MRSKDRNRDREAGKKPDARSREKDREKRSERETKERHNGGAKERHRSPEKSREGRRSSKERYRRDSRTREDSRDQEHRRREHRRSRSHSRDRKHRGHDKERRRSWERHDSDSSRMEEVPGADLREYEYRGMEYTQSVLDSIFSTAATSDNYAQLLNTYSQQQQIQEQQQQIQAQQALLEQHNENSCSSIGSRGEMYGGLVTNSHSSGGEGEPSRKRRKKSRWAGGDQEKTFIPGMPTIIPPTLTPNQQEAYLVQIQIEEISRKLRTGDLMIPQNPEERSPSPEPIYSSDGKRLNTREFRTRKKLEEQRHQLIQRMQAINPDFKPPSDYKPPVIRVSDKVLIPQEEHPDINFVGLLIGPRGNTLKAMEKDTGAKIIIRGKGSVKEGKVGRKDGQPLPGEDEPLHAFITASNPEAVKKAVDRIKDVIRQGIEVPEGHNDLRRMQLRELAQLNGTLRETDGPRCNNCGSNEHKSWLCPDKPNITNNIMCSACGGTGHIARDCRSKRPGHGGPPAPGNALATKIDEEYMSLMAELGEVPPHDSHGHGGGGGRGSYNLFESRSVPRPLMGSSHHGSSLLGSGSGKGGGGGHSSNGMWSHSAKISQSTPTASLPAPPPTGSVPSLMQWPISDGRSVPTADTSSYGQSPVGVSAHSYAAYGTVASTAGGAVAGWVSADATVSGVGGSLLGSVWPQVSAANVIPPPPPSTSSAPSPMFVPPPPPPC
ncbi:splicing factor 1-like [Anopheles cruzii]|uniref:splicing factor 1-like n=1 Tax=Anopheles cruzii TaxID=68878 RepID=UPI0022EC44F4|nr:splicing factor 1-like [Anopheles cruzii]